MILRTFRPFRPDDLESLVGLTVRAFEPVQDAIRHQLGDELFDRQNGQWEQDYRDTLAGLTGPQHSHRFLVAVAHGEPVGGVRGPRPGCPGQPGAPHQPLRRRAGGIFVAVPASSLVPCTVRDQRKDRTVRITASAVSLNVADPEASSQFLQRHFGFAEAMSADGFASLARPDAGLNVVFLRTGLGVPVATPLATEPWGERHLQVPDPNGIVVQLVQWEGSTGSGPA